MYKYLYYLLIIVGLIISYIIYNCLSENFVAISNVKPIKEVWGIDSDNELWKASLPCTNNNCNWSKVNGKYKQIFQNSTDIWGITLTNSIFRCSKPCDGNWIKIPGSLNQISIGKDSVWGIDDDKNIKYCNNTITSPCAGDWEIANTPEFTPPKSTKKSTKPTKSTTKLKEIWVIDSENKIWKAPLPCVNRNCKWTNINGIFKQISQGANDIWGIAPDNSISRCSKPCNGTWIKVQGFLKQISAGIDTVWGIDNNKNIKYCNNTKASPCTGDWKNINKPKTPIVIPFTDPTKNTPINPSLYSSSKDVDLREVWVENS